MAKTTSISRSALPLPEARFASANLLSTTVVLGQPHSWFLSFARTLKGDGAESVDAIFSMLQHVLMAQRKNDFLAVQLEPAFSAFARANAVTLTRALKGGDLRFTAEWNRIFAAGWEERVPERLLTAYTGGPGDSPNTAVSIQAPDLATAIHGEYWYLFYYYGRNWKLGGEQRTMPAADGRVFDQVELIFPGRPPEWAYFDVPAVVTPSSKPV